MSRWRYSRRCIWMKLDGEPVRVQTNGRGQPLSSRDIEALRELVKAARKRVAT